MNAMLDQILQGSNPQADTDYYQIIGCDETANEEQIQAEYKQKALQLHPDRNRDDAAKQQFQLLQEAREVLLDAEMRTKYDRWKRSGLAVPFKQYANVNNISFHWASRATKELSVTDGSVASLSKKEDMDYARRQTLTGAESSLSNWRAQGATADELLKKFRNYEI
ncbi:J domain-containing protein [Galendromus occidentalis]|uniref:J domain-containing protein n=1 Tax=Galendromus occidentalis TaxID=34638 RepID=A0AAJ6QRJ1_9ACAR|nr:J domain-containing protein [Galendromus occidentalis]